jgi:hypothetical protein
MALKDHPCSVAQCLMLPGDEVLCFQPHRLDRWRRTEILLHIPARSLSDYIQSSLFNSLYSSFFEENPISNPTLLGSPTPPTSNQDLRYSISNQSNPVVLHIPVYNLSLGNAKRPEVDLDIPSILRLNSSVGCQQQTALQSSPSGRTIPHIPIDL